MLKNVKKLQKTFKNGPESRTFFLPILPDRYRLTLLSLLLALKITTYNIIPNVNKGLTSIPNHQKKELTSNFSQRKITTYVNSQPPKIKTYANYPDSKNKKLYQIAHCEK